MFLIIYMILGGILIYYAGLPYIKDKIISKELKSIQHSSNETEFMNLVGQNKPCYGIFKLSTKNPVSNKKYGVPQCLSYRVWKESNNGNKISTYTTLAESICHDMYMNKTNINASNLFTNLWYNTKEIYDWTKGSYDMIYTPNNIQCILAYSAKEKCFLIFSDINSSIDNQYNSNRHLFRFILVLFIVIAPTIKVIYLITKMIKDDKG